MPLIWSNDVAGKGGVTGRPNLGRNAAGVWQTVSVTEESTTRKGTTMTLRDELQEVAPDLLIPMPDDATACGCCGWLSAPDLDDCPSCDGMKDC